MALVQRPRDSPPNQWTGLTAALTNLFQLRLGSRSATPETKTKKASSNRGKRMYHQGTGNPLQENCRLTRLRVLHARQQASLWFALPAGEVCTTTAKDGEHTQGEGIVWRCRI